MKQFTAYQMWCKNHPMFTGFGSFHTSLLRTYQLADDTNRQALEGAFPDWFVKIVHSELAESIAA